MNMMRCITSILIVVLFAGCSKNDAPDVGETAEDANTNDEKSKPVLGTLEVGAVTSTTAIVSSSVVNNGSGNIRIRGFCWDEIGNPSLQTSNTEATSVQGSGKFSAQLDKLEDGKTYYLRAYATNDIGVSYSEIQTFKTDKIPDPIIYLDGNSFASQEVFEQYWNILYPWGSDHNGSARMYAERVNLEPDGVLLIDAKRVVPSEGNSSADPWLRIDYHSGAIHFNKHITVTDELPVWEISGDFQVPTVRGSWPAFWITGAWSWPPESDIMEFKGDNTNWQNTVTGPDWQNTSWQTTNTVVSQAGHWHNYKLIMRKISQWDVSLEYYIDGERKATHKANFVGKPFWLIINMQMEGSSGPQGSGPQSAQFRGRNVYVAAWPPGSNK